MEPVQETERINAIYQSRGYDRDPAYLEVTNPQYLQRVQGLERHTIIALAKGGIAAQVPALKVVDLGCGNGHWLARWLSWGATAANLTGTDLRAAALEEARRSVPCVSLVQMRPEAIPLRSESADAVSVNLVFSSILSDSIRSNLAREVRRVLRPGGLLLWYDFVYDNPRNRDVRAVRRRHARQLWRGMDAVHEASLSLAPPVARALGSRWGNIPAVLEMLAPPLRSHYFCAMRNP